jgi:GDPmannose 4,6-dehydratase
MNRTCIITGVNGQLGQYFVKYLQENEPEIKIIGTIRHKSFEQQEYLFDREGVVFELMDLSDVHSIENLIIKYKPDYFLNFAANAIVPESWETPVQQMEVNFISVIHQLEAIRKHSPSTKYFNCGSSTEFAASKTPLSESSPLSPSSPYAVAKTAARNLIDIYRQRYGLYALQGWLFNFESKIRGEKYLTRKVTSNVGRIRKALKEGKNFNPLQLGNINGIRSYLHCEDVVKGIWLMINQEFANPFLTKILDNIIDDSHYSWRLDLIPAIKPYLLSSSSLYSVKDFVTKAFEYAGFRGYWYGWGMNEKYYITDLTIDSQNNYRWSCNRERVIGVEINQKFFRPLDTNILCGDAALIEKELGWKPQISFDEIVKEMVDYDCYE